MENLRNNFNKVEDAAASIFVNETHFMCEADLAQALTDGQEVLAENDLGEYVWFCWK